MYKPYTVYDIVDEYFEEHPRLQAVDIQFCHHIKDDYPRMGVSFVVAKRKMSGYELVDHAEDEGAHSRFNLSDTVEFHSTMKDLRTNLDLISIWVSPEDIIHD